jgi:prepilin-type N-terminal cleavage/methylation domain-containing protein/prepilin-type processing-associated H-X9-DG protein
MSKTSRDKLGFTLTEFMVVLAIIAIIFGLLVPSLNIAREKARRAACASNLHQIGVAIFAYANDHNLNLPTTINNNIAGAAVTWDRALMNGYIQSARVFVCPSDKVPRTLGSVRSYSISKGNQGSDYVYWVAGAKLTSPWLSASSDILLVGESARDKNVLGTAVGCGYVALGLTNDVASQHDGRSATCGNGQPKANYLFLDGHVVWADICQTNWFPTP